MIITISGDIGSGKSTVGKILAKSLGYNYLSTGKIQRNIANKLGISTLELNILSEKQSDIDDKIDSYTKARNNSDANYIVDSRLAWHFISKSLKVYLNCDIEVAVQRISQDEKRLSEKQNEMVSVLLARIVERRRSEKRRFLQKYGIDYTDLSNYDFILDTAPINTDEVVEEILKQLKFRKRFF